MISKAVLKKHFLSNDFYLKKKVLKYLNKFKNKLKAIEPNASQMYFDARMFVIS